MSPASESPSVYGAAASPRRRAIGLVLAAIAHGLLLLMLLKLSPAMEFVPFGRAAPTLVDLLPAEQESAAKSATKAKVRASTRKAPEAPAPAPRAVTPPVPRPDDDRPLNIIPLTSKDYAASDIGRLPSRRAGASGGGDAGTGQATAAAEGAGQGPGGATLYAADWYRRPTDAELSFYVKDRASKGARAEIACRMVAQYRVEDCRPLGETPAGSGLARAIVAASWQFRVLPPRVNGRQELGLWVRITIDWGSGGVE